jgi:hypothetical protein
MANADQGAHSPGRAKLRNSTTVFLVGNIEPTMEVPFGNQIPGGADVTSAGTRFT